MPLTTEIGFQTHPDIEIIVHDTSGGGSNAHVVDLVVVYDPDFMRFDGVATGTPPPTLSDNDVGICKWNQVDCGTGMTFSLELTRIQAGTTHVGAASFDYDSNESKARTLAVPSTFKKPASKVKRKSMKKKGRKKA